MFFIKKLRREVELEPRFLGPQLKEHVRNKVTAELEGQCLGKHGYVISLLEIKDEDILPGLVDNDSGAVHITVYYSVVLLRLFRNEVVDAVVSMASDQNGFFARVGPLLIFVSRHSMPDDISFNHIDGDCWKSEDEKVEIREGSIVRLKVIGLNVEKGSISAVGTIKENFLGQLEI
eukprot:gene7398-8184_t